jgi:hypothetical protein
MPVHDDTYAFLPGAAAYDHVFQMPDVAPTPLPVPPPKPEHKPLPKPEPKADDDDDEKTGTKRRK